MRGNGSEERSIPESLGLLSKIHNDRALDARISWRLGRDRVEWLVYCGTREGIESELGENPNYCEVICNFSEWAGEEGFVSLLYFSSRDSQFEKIIFSLSPSLLNRLKCQIKVPSRQPFPAQNRKEDLSNKLNCGSRRCRYFQTKLGGRMGKCLGKPEVANFAFAMH